MPDPEPIIPYPDPPAVRAAPLALAFFGVAHLVVAVLFGESLQMFNLVIGLAELVVAIWLFAALSGGRKKHEARLAQLRVRNTPPPTGAA